MKKRLVSGDGSQIGLSLLVLSVRNLQYLKDKTFEGLRAEQPSF